MLPPIVRTAAGGTLTDEDRMQLVAACRSGEPDAIRRARDGCDAASIAAFGWALFAQWAGARAPSRDPWAGEVVARLADESTTPLVANRVREWGNAGALRAMQAGLEALVAMAPDNALVELSRLTTSQGALMESAEAALARALANRGLTEADLDDRLVSDCSLGSDGRVVLDYGPRQFVVVIGDRYDVHLEDADGRRMASLPRPTKNDDASHVAIARERWSDIQSTFRDVMGHEARRMQFAMRTRRRWSVDNFRRSIVGHPVLGRLAHRTVWASYEAATPRSFRVDEDGTFADVSDHPITDLRGPIGIPHRMDLPDRDAWAHVFIDYEIVQSFAQLDGGVHFASDEERGDNQLRRFEGVELRPTALFALESRGWQQLSFYSLTREIEGTSCIASIDLDAGPGGHRIRRVAIDRGTFGDLDPIAFCELVADIEAVRE